MIQDFFSRLFLGQYHAVFSGWHSTSRAPPIMCFVVLQCTPLLCAANRDKSVSRLRRQTTAKAFFLGLELDAPDPRSQVSPGWPQFYTSPRCTCFNDPRTRTHEAQCKNVCCSVQPFTFWKSEKIPKSPTLFGMISCRLRGSCFFASNHLSSQSGSTQSSVLC